MAITIVAMILGAVMGKAGTLDRPRAEASLKRAWASVAPTPVPVAVPALVERGREADVHERVATSVASGSPTTSVMLAVATTLFAAWSLARIVARWLV